MSKRKVAIVTGAAGGIGQEIARRLADDGFHIVISDTEGQRQALNALADTLFQDSEPPHVAPADVRYPASVDSMVSSAVDRFGRVDVMVANAGVVTASPLLELSVDEWDQVMAVNARGTLLCYQAAARQMIRQGKGGKIIGAASVAAHQSSALVGHYSASKFAIRSLTQAAALEWARHGITVNAYSPGLVDTAMWDALDEQITSLEGLERGDAFKAGMSEIPLGRVQRPQDVAGMVSFLASADADYMTGQAVVIDGGMLLG
ncbi:SDR family oxidoreductase [Natronospirillum operosum]|uniref:SDR family oxidoreductase n=1 Tax=Natronospirillum operosum TaxID=2759953 RepID=A0A4Z0WIZ7_9GAMM|nr:SDR family oxidoreductase [Natronospirillum operosum]TGG95453.1 SDR family oxidoreductase [Natronospirillum operosum]